MEKYGVDISLVRQLLDNNLVASEEEAIEKIASGEAFGLLTPLIPEDPPSEEGGGD